MKLVSNADGQYDEYILNLRNHEKVRQGFINQTTITSLEHQHFMNLHRDQYYVGKNSNGDIVGFVGAADKDIRIALDPEYSGNGYATKMLQEYIKILGDNIHDYSVKVKIDNRRSFLLFKRCGFMLKSLVSVSQHLSLYEMRFKK